LPRIWEKRNASNGRGLTCAMCRDRFLNQRVQLAAF
jgi:hypothetical protein